MDIVEKIDKCPFCDHIIIKKNGKCPNCRKLLEELFFEPIYCSNCGTKSFIKNSKCSNCNINIELSDFEYGKYIELPKKRRVNLITEREEIIYNKLKSFYFGEEAKEREKFLEKIGSKYKKLYSAIILFDITIQLIFLFLSFFTKIFEWNKELPTYMLVPKKFIMPFFLWFLLKSIFLIFFFFLSKLKPVYTYVSLIIFTIITYIFETVTFPDIPFYYSIIQFIIFILLLYGSKISLYYEDYLNHKK